MKIEEAVDMGFNIYRSVLDDNDKLRKENESLKKQLQEKKAAHTETKTRIIFGMHILSGNREERVKQFCNQGYSYPVNF
jgi:regulator of replication initiation timing